MSVAKIHAILDPPARKVKRGAFKGSWVKADAYYELEGVIQDLRHQKGDRICIRTLERVQKQIARVLKICEKQAAQ